MLANEDILNDFGRKVIQAIIEDQRNKGIRASGRSAQSLNAKLEKIPKGLRLQILGEDYFEFQEEGRGPTKSGGGWSDPEGDIIAWMKTKPGFIGLPQKELKRIAGAILYGPEGIHETGTRLHKEIKSGDRSNALSLTDIITNESELLRVALIGRTVQNYKSEILRAWRQ